MAQPKPRYVVPGSLNKAQATNSTVQIYATIRQALLDYVTPQDEMLREIVGDPPRIYVRSAPDGVVFPYITLLLSRTSQAAYNGYRETAQLEVQAIGRPESQLPMVETAVDLVDQCLTAYTNPASGLIVGRSRTRSTLPMFSDPAESAVVAVLARYELYLWPSVLTSRV
jgi:hypothetical protein